MLASMKLFCRTSLVILLTTASGVSLFLVSLAYVLRQEDNYSRIEDHLYMGGAVVAPPRGTRAVLNLCEKEDPYRCEFHVWEPLADSEPAPSLDWLRRMVDLLDKFISSWPPMASPCPSSSRRPRSESLRHRPVTEETPGTLSPQARPAPVFRG